MHARTDPEVKRSQDGLRLGWLRGVGLQLDTTAHFVAAF